MLNQRYSKARQNPRAHPTGSSSATSPTVENNSERDEALRSPSVAPAPKSLLPAAVVVKTGHPLLASATVETLPASAAVETLPASVAVDTIPVASLVVVSTTVTESLAKFPRRTNASSGIHSQGQHSEDWQQQQQQQQSMGHNSNHDSSVQAAQMQPMSSNVTSNVK
nr:transcriptional corepressor SEUSS-like [Ipomoea batatas]